MSPAELNQMPKQQLCELFSGWCGCEQFANAMADRCPFEQVAQVHQNADEVMDQLSADDWLEAFASHPKLGATRSPQMHRSGNRQWSAEEQSGTTDAGTQQLERLAELNQKYFERFGFIFILKATGATIDDMIASIMERLQNDVQTEQRIAATQQRLITHLRIDKQFA